MTSLRHNADAGHAGPDAAPRDGSAVEDLVLDAARAGILATGWRRSTLTDVAARAGVSRMTIYRRWPTMHALLAELLTREAGALAAGRPDASPAEVVVGTVQALRGNELFAKIVEVDPELLLPYLLQRRGRAQDALLGDLAQRLARGQRAGAVRPGDPVLMARAVLLAAHGFALSAATMTDPDGVSVDDLDAELHRLVAAYVAA